PWPFDDLIEIGKTAAAPVASGGQRIQLEGQPPIPLPDFEGRRHVTLPGGNDQPKCAGRPTDQPLRADDEVIISKRKAFGRRQLHTDAPAALDELDFRCDQPWTGLSLLN